MSFSTLGLHSSLLETLAALGYREPTAVQRTAIPAALAGADLLVSSQTGSGKTAAFMLPSLHRLLAGDPAAKPIHPKRSYGPRILVLTPTRELALQVEKAARAYGDGQRLRTACLVGGILVIYAIGIGDSRYDGIDKGALNNVAERTGGRAFFPKKGADLTSVFAEIEKELRSQYLLAYSSANKNRDGAFRQTLIEIVNPDLRKDQLRLRYRPGYFAKLLNSPQR